jgi:hypothetical protein
MQATSPKFRSAFCEGAGTDVSRPSDPPEKLPSAGQTTPPPDARTDRGRGTGELGPETADPDKPLTD